MCFAEIIGRERQEKGVGQKAASWRWIRVSLGKEGKKKILTKVLEGEREKKWGGGGASEVREGISTTGGSEGSPGLGERRGSPLLSKPNAEKEGGGALRRDGPADSSFGVKQLHGRD